MKISEIQKILNAKVHCGQDKLDMEVFSAFGSDMMSDVLAFVKNQPVLLTGLLNLQTVRTAMMVDTKCIIFVRGKTPDQNTIDLGEQNGMILMSTDERMYSACGKLYMNGLRGESGC